MRRIKSAPAHGRLAEYIEIARKGILLGALVLSVAGCYGHRPYYADYYGGQSYEYYGGGPGVYYGGYSGVYPASCCFAYAEYPTRVGGSSLGVGSGLATGGYGSRGGFSHSGSHHSSAASGFLGMSVGGSHGGHGSRGGHGSSRGSGSAGSAR